MKSEALTTECGQIASDELSELHFLIWQMATDIKYQEFVFQEDSKQQGVTEPTTGQRHRKHTLKFLGISQFCRAVDIYNWYCHESLKLALSSSPKSIVEVIRKQTGNFDATIKKVAKKILDAEKKRKNKGKEVAKSITDFFEVGYKGEKIFRETIHLILDVMQEPEIELLCLCRNILVHKRGHDVSGKITAEIKKLGTKRALIGAQSYPRGHMPISVNEENYLVINEDVANWATELLIQQICRMDQNFAHVYKLPRKIWKPWGSSNIGL